MVLEGALAWAGFGILTAVVAIFTGTSVYKAMKQKTKMSAHKPGIVTKVTPPGGGSSGAQTGASNTQQSGSSNPTPVNPLTRTQKVVAGAKKAFGWFEKIILVIVGIALTFWLYKEGFLGTFTSVSEIPAWVNWYTFATTVAVIAVLGIALYGAKGAGAGAVWFTRLVAVLLLCFLIIGPENFFGIMRKIWSPDFWSSTNSSSEEVVDAKTIVRREVTIPPYGKKVIKRERFCNTDNRQPEERALIQRNDGASDVTYTSTIDREYTVWVWFYDYGNDCTSGEARLIQELSNR
jgi:hypothetical protein